MLKRILSAFLLCLCVSPVWAGAFEKISLFGYTDNVSDSVSVGGNKYAHCSGNREGRGQVGAAAKGVDLYVLNNGSWKVYHCDGSKWSEGRDVPDCTTECGSEIIVHRGDNQRFYSLYKKKNTNVKTAPEDSRIIFTKETDSLCKSMTSALVGGRVLPCPQEDSYNNAAECQQTCRGNVWTWDINKCKEGYEKKGTDCVLKQKKCDGKEVGYKEDVDLTECQADWERRGWTGGGQATSCKKTCFDLGNGSAEWRYVVGDCKAGYQRVNENKIICEQKNVTDPKTCESDCKDNSECKICCGYMQNDPNIFWCPWNGCQCEGDNDELVDGKCVSDSSSSSSGTDESSAQSTIPDSEQSCLNSRDTLEGKACCHLRSDVAEWKNNSCVCVKTNKEFRMKADGTGECVDKPAGASQPSDVTTDENLQTPVTECTDSAKVASPAGETCPGDSNKKINVTAKLKDIYTGEDLVAVIVAVLNTTQGVWIDNTGKFTLNNIPENAKLEISYGGKIIFYVCASELQNKSLICANSATDLDNVTVYACAGSVLHDLNASDGKPKQDEKGTWCDIECPNGYTRQEKIQTLQFRDRATGNMIDSPQRYICVANGDVTTDNTATPTPGGEDNSGATAPAKPDGTPCTPTDKNAKSGKYQNGECIIVECNGAYYKVSDDKKSCVEDKKAKSQAKIDELQKNADAMKEKEQSTANKLLGGAAIGATGIGAMQAASAYSEQQADEEAEQAMRAYLATFHCNYGGGINVKGGEKDVQLPGGNELIDLYAEYVNLANNLKVRKAALDLRPGIESEAILDSATSGLYDDVAIGKTSGAFTSLARALQDPEGEDAKAWAAQKDDSAKKMKTGLTVAGIGAIGGAVGNLIINKDSEKENSKEILDKYKDGDLTGKVSKSPDGKLVAEPVNQETLMNQSTVNSEAITDPKSDQMIVVSPDPDNTGKSVETVVEETQESTPKQDNVVTDYHHGDKVEYIKRIENITDADAAFNKLAQQFGKTPINDVKNTYDGFVTTCRKYNGVLSIELDTLRRYERDMYDVLCYFPDLDQTPDIVKVAYDTDKRVLDNSVSVSEGIRLSKLAPFKDTQYKKNEDAFWQRLTEFNSTWSSSSRNCKIPELPSLWKCTKYSAMIRIHDRDGKMYLEMTKWQDRPGGNSDNYFVGK